MISHSTRTTAVLRLARVFLVAALMTSIGAQWTVMQSAAWLGMAVTYTLREGSLGKGLSQTFDGEHLCPRCKAIQKERDSEKTDPKAETKLKPELFVVHRTLFIQPPVAGIAFDAVMPDAGALPVAPPLRPPRVSIV